MTGYDANPIAKLLGSSDLFIGKKMSPQNPLFDHHVPYPLVNIAIETGHRNSGFIHKK
jgi:hypothetical protein